MALADWTDLLGGDKFTLSVDHVYSGARALKIETANYSRAAKVLTQSITDSPTIANVESWGYMTTNSSNIAFIFRGQDNDNYYSAFFDQSGTTIAFWFQKWVAGGGTSLGYTVISNLPVNNWYLFKVMFCEIGGQIYAEAYVDGTLKAHLVDTSPSLASGGGVGVGAPYKSQSTGYSWIDETKIYY